MNDLIYVDSINLKLPSIVRRINKDDLNEQALKDKITTNFYPKYKANQILLMNNFSLLNYLVLNSSLKNKTVCYISNSCKKYLNNVYESLNFEIRYFNTIDEIQDLSFIKTIMYTNQEDAFFKNEEEIYSFIAKCKGIRPLIICLDHMRKYHFELKTLANDMYINYENFFFMNTLEILYKEKSYNISYIVGDYTKIVCLQQLANNIDCTLKTDNIDFVIEHINYLNYIKRNIAKNYQILANHLKNKDIDFEELKIGYYLKVHKDFSYFMDKQIYVIKGKFNESYIDLRNNSKEFKEITTRI